MEQYPTDKMIYEVGKLILAQAISMAAGMDPTEYVEHLLKSKLNL